jgi:hypothetical protein
MPNNFQSIQQQHLNFINGGFFGEQITTQYVIFCAVIDRILPEEIAKATGEQRATAPVAEFWVPSSKFTCPPKKNDVFTYPTRAGDKPTDHRVSVIVKQDASGWLVRCN